MSQYKDAHEVESLVIGKNPDYIGFFSGSNSPEIEVPDAPINAFYYRSDGRIYRNKNLAGGSGSLSGDWELQQQIGSVPFFNADGTQDDVDLVSGSVPFFNADGTQDNVDL